MTIHLRPGRFTSGTNAGSVIAASLAGCSTAHRRLPVRVSLGAFPWHLSLSHYNAARRVTTGSLSGLHLAISIPLLGCTAAADGTGPDSHNGLLAASYSNKTHVLSGVAAGSRLRVYDVSHCDGLIKNGNAVVFSVNYAIRPGVKITHS
jgi:hypothetical protein